MTTGHTPSLSLISDWLSSTVASRSSVEPCLEVSPQHSVIDGNPVWRPQGWYQKGTWLTIRTIQPFSYFPKMELSEWLYVWARVWRTNLWLCHKTEWPDPFLAISIIEAARPPEMGHPLQWSFQSGSGPWYSPNHARHTAALMNFNSPTEPVVVISIIRLIYLSSGSSLELDHHVFRLSN